jgi:hypothetical protein
LLAPNPVNGGSGTLALEVSDPMMGAEIDIYSHALAKVAHLSWAGALGPGWISVPLDMGGLSSGTYFLRIKAKGDADDASTYGPVKLMLLR